MDSYEVGIDDMFVKVPSEHGLLCKFVVALA